MGVNKTRQAGTETLEAYRKSDRAESYICEVMAVYSERNTCDIKSWCSGGLHKDVPILTKGGLVDGEVYGEINLPAIGDRVVIDFLGGKESLPIIVGFIFPYLNNKFAKGTPVDSSSKTYTKTFLEENKPKTYKRIFPSGTTVEVQEDGSLIIETPSGSFIKIDESSSGDISIEANSNTFSMESGKVVINGNWEVLQ